MQVYENLKKKIPNLSFIVQKNTNQNVVIYEGQFFLDELTPDDPFDIYWLDIDPAYQKKARAEGRTSDRVELSFFEKQIAYGPTYKKSHDPNKYFMTLSACPNRLMYVYYDHNTKQTITETKIVGKKCQLLSIMVNLKSAMAVDNIELYGYDHVNNSFEHEIIKK